MSRSAGTEVTTRARSSRPAVLWAVAGSFAFTLVYSSAWLSHGQIEPLQLIFLRYAGGAVLALMIALALDKSLESMRSPPRAH